MVTDMQRRFLAAQRVARFATASRDGRPHVVPVCYAVEAENAYFSIDEKPKREAHARLKRLDNIRENASVALVVDRYDDDWSRLGWVMLQGEAEILAGGDEHDHAQALLRARYPQLTSMRIESLPVVAVRIRRVLSWGNLDAD